MDALDINLLENTVLSPSASLGNLSNIPKLPEFPQNIVDKESTNPTNMFHEDMIPQNNEKIATLFRNRIFFTFA